MVDPLSSALLGALGATFSALHQWAVERGADRLVHRARELGSPERVLAQAARELADLRTTEFRRLADNEWAAVQIAVAGSLRAARLDEAPPAVLVSANRLRARVRAAGRAELRSAGLDDSGREAYHRLLRHTCRRMAQRARAVDGVMQALHAEVAGNVEELKHQVGELAAEPARRGDGFERAYVGYVAEEYATFELFQVSMGRAPALHSFDHFYTAPSIARRQRSDDDVELTGAGTDSANAIGSARRVLLLGGAGAGKTTFLRWLLHTAAVSVRDGREGPWYDAIPFFVSLRQFGDRPLPAPEDLVAVTAPPLAGEKPDRWVSTVLRSGRAMVLVDGVDELLYDRREEVRRWLTGLVRAYPDARYVVSTRPSAVPDDWPGADFGRFELLPLSSRGLQNLIGRWYEAARALEADPVQRAWLAGCEERLVRSLTTRPDVRSLVSSPLLCSLLCALYRQENMYLPQSRKELLDKALELLLGQWDVQRDIAVEDELRMSTKEKVVLLERFAAPMVRNAELMVTEEVAARRFGRAMSGLRSEARELRPEQVLRHMLERTGLLRERDGRIQFVHRTFRDFLAAGEFVKAGELGYLIDHAHDDSLYEVVFMAAAQARAREAGELLGRLLERAGKRVTRKDRETADRLELLAAASLGYVDVIDPEHVRVDVLAAVRRLIPPRTFQDAELLARAGGFVADLLPGPIEVGKHADEAGADRAEVAARVIRTLAMIGGEEAWEKIQAFTGTDRGVVIDELLRAWRQFDHSEDYARTLLSDVDFGELVLEVHRWDVLARLRHLKKLTAVQLIGDIALTDREGRRPLADIPNLRHLEIRSNEVADTLSGLAGCDALRVLWISGYSALRDLSALAGLGVEELRLHTTGGFGDLRAPRLATLAGSRVRRLSIRHPALARGLGVLPEDLPLAELVLDARAEYRSLRGVERFPGLRKVSVHGIPDTDEVRALGALPALEHLVVQGAHPVADLVRLRPLSGVKVELFDVPDLRAARDALPETELVLHPREKAAS
ncbi:NACHT domain-containing protein [Amycolatopsis sacchari]|uniref:NACHT domain-containing protein n=1 Tax=Amycolatopsis sacchari TaxID=115433 RepID=A0A1I4BFD8_9PSEU|nr:NACHT domain-containing protein [Amycolatopsis sacchari]SFK67582.1 NACHT domain-containing protein [Amycolatopsis sacchari]